MQLIKTISEARRIVGQVRCDGRKVGLVPTMGALHAGHMSLIQAARQACDFVVVTIFVNPTQFGAGEDLGKYPRDLERDSEMCRLAGADMIFAPDPEQMYPDEPVTWVNVEGLTEGLCGQSRLGHFRGVTTVCAKLFNIIRADIAFFGQKDAQQVIVIKRMVADLNIPLRIAVCPTVRDPDGLAISSRNQYLSPEERKDALLLYAALQECRRMIDGGCRSCPELIGAMHKVLGQSPRIVPDYVSIVDTETLKNIEAIDQNALVAVAVKVGATRLIDNIIVDLNKPDDI